MLEKENDSIVGAAMEKNAVDFRDAVTKALSARIAASLEDRKKEVAKSMFARTTKEKEE
jgi:hypothetical protein